jgi:NitT/TauT family transport system ATP-binding protein
LSAAPAPAVSQPAIRLAGVRRTFVTPGGSTLVALEGLDLEVEANEIVSIIGPNGSGKSTLLRIAGGLLAADAGTVEVEGRAVSGPDRAVGFVFQEPRLLPWRDTLSNVAYPLEIAEVPRAEREARAHEMLRLVGLDGFATARPHHLSGGMRQRVALARALALGPSVLLLDEPFSALDALTRERFDIELLRLWAKTSTTVVVVTHSISESVLLADRVVVLSARPGHVVTIVRPGLRRPRTLEDLASPALAEAAATVRAALGQPGDPDPTPGTRIVSTEGPE